MRTFLVALRALLYGACFMLLWWWVASGFKTYDQVVGIRLPLWVEDIGIILMVLGGSIAVLCLVYFVMRGKGTPAPFDAPREFVALGPYRYVRNPMYIGGWITLVGFGLFERSVSILLFSLAWISLAHLFVFFVEEPQLEQRFGQSYIQYKNSVHRWIPQPGKKG